MASPRTKIVFYSSLNATRRGTYLMERQGWTVVSAEITDEGYGCANISWLDVVFLPLALIGKRPDRYKVEYRRRL